MMGRGFLGRGHLFSWRPLLTASVLMHIVLLVPSDLCGLMPKCDHLCFVISRLGYQVLINLGALGFTIIMGVSSGLLTGQCETTLLPPLSRAQVPSSSSQRGLPGQLQATVCREDVTI